MPVSENLLKEYDLKIVKNNLMSIQALIKESNCLYINLEGDKQFKTDSLFFDGDHLNYKGATIATLEIKNRILNSFSN